MAKTLPPAARGFLALALVLLLASTAHVPAASSLHVLASPHLLVLQPDAANGTDTYLLSGKPIWNFGDNATLLDGPDPSTGFLSRTLLRFDVSSVPSNATVLDARLGLLETQGSGGSVQVRRGLASWMEGNDGRSWARIPVLVQETAGVARTLEPVGVTVSFPPGSVADPAKDVLVYDGSREVPSQVRDITTSAGEIQSAQVWFDATVGAGQEKWFNITFSTNETATPAYRQRSFGTAPLWSFNATGGGASSVTVADVDGDGRLEVLFGGTDGRLYALDDQGHLEWFVPVSPGGKSIPYAPQVADMDHDGQMSIVVLTNDPSVVRLNATGGVIWRFTPSASVTAPPTLTDVNGDGHLDVLVAGKMNAVQAIDGPNGTLLRSYPAGAATYGPAVGLVQGVPMVFFGSDDKLVHGYYLRNGTQAWANAPAGTGFIEEAVLLADVNGDGIPEVIAGDNNNNGHEFALRATDGGIVWSTALPGFRRAGGVVADLNGTGALQVLVGLDSGTLNGLRGTDGRLLWTFAGSTYNPMYPAVADVTNSGSPDVVFLDGSTTLAVVNRTGTLLRSWTVAYDNQAFSSSQLPMATPAVVDLDGGGTLQISVPTGNGIQSFETAGLDHDWRGWGYELNHTQAALDRNSFDGAPFLQVSVGPTSLYPASGASWNYRDGVQPWSLAGGDFGVPEANASGAPGWMQWNLTGMVQDWVRGASPNLGLALTEASEVTGVLHAFASSDDANASARPRLVITYALGTSVAAAPRILGRIPDQERAENSPPWTLDLSAYAADNDTPLGLLRWNVTGYDPDVIGVTGLNVPGSENLTFYPAQDAWGSFQVTYWLTDPQGRLATQTAWLNLTHVNAPPGFEPPTAFSVEAAHAYPFDFGPYISDPDTPRSQLTLSTSDPDHTAVSGFNVTFLYPSSFLGRWTYANLTVSDGLLSVTRTVSVHVVSDAPPIGVAPLPDVALYQGAQRVSVFNLTTAFEDPEGDPLAFSAGPSREGVAIHANGSVDLTAPSDWWGVDSVTFRATDPSGAFAEDTVLVTVLHIDAPPVLAGVPDLRVRYDAPYSFNLDPYLSDPDTPLASLTVTATDPAHAGLSGHLLTLLYPAALNGTVQNLTLTVSDGVLSASQSIQVAVGSDWPPSRVQKLPDAAFRENTVLRGAYNLSRAFVDLDGATLFWSSGNRSVLVTIRPNGTVDLGARADWWGVERVTFRATDPQGALQEDSVWIRVLRVDDAPFFRPVPTQRLNATTTYVPLTPYLGDADDNVSVLFLAGTNSTHALAIGQGLLFNYSSDTTEWVQVTVSDGNLTNTTALLVIVTLPPPTVERVIPGWLFWLPLPSAAALVAAFIVYRWRKLEWAFLVTNDGLLVSSVSRRGPVEIDTDLVTGMLTVIMDFAKRSFSDEKERNLEGLEMGDKRVTLVRGQRAFLAVVYRGRTPGRLLPIMRSLLERIEKDHHDALGDIVDTTTLGDVPLLLERLVTRGNLPFVAFGVVQAEA